MAKLLDVYFYVPQIWLSFLTTLFLFGLSVYSWRRRTVPGALPFAFGALFAALWVLGILVEYAAEDVAVAAFWHRFQLFWQFPATIAITGFILEYIWPGRWLTRRNIIVFAILPFLLKEILLTNGIQPGLVSSLGLAYSYALSFIVMASLIWLYFRTPQYHWPAATMLVGQLGARLVYGLNLAQILHTDLPIDVIAIAFVFLMYAIALFGFHIFDPDTLARQVAISQMPTGMVVLNSQQQLISLNPAAGRLLGITNVSMRSPDLSLTQFLPLDAIDFGATDADQVEVHLGNADAPLVCLLSASALQDWRGLNVGYLLLLHDITAQKQDQVQLIAQQRAVATLQERERLARELHDSLGQALAATHLQAGAARHLLAQGQLDPAEQCLAQIAEISLSAEADVRDYLLGAKTAFTPDTPFLETVRRYAARFGQQYSLQMELDASQELEAQGLGFPVEVQLMRVIQEALSNVRKHAAADGVQICLTMTDALIELMIVDDGQGFDTAQALQANGFGLQSMRERVATLAGALDIISRPGAGTQIIVRIPRQVEIGLTGKVLT